MVLGLLSKMLHQRLVFVVTAVYAALCLAYINATPYRTPGHLISRTQSVQQGDIGAPDERQHSNYVRHLASGRGFPVFKPDSPDLYENYQAHQPPLYYLLCAPLDMAANEASEKWLLRLVNVLLGSITIGLIFLGVRRFTNNEDVALFCGGFTAMLPMFVAIGAAVTNDMLLYLIAALCMNAIAYGWEKGWSTRNCVLLGCVLGLGLLTKTSAILLFPVALAGLLMKNRPSIAKISGCFLVAFALASPWLIRNQVLYGDPLAIGAFRQASVGNLPASAVISELGAASYWISWVGAAAVRSFWGVFGYFDVFLSDTAYRLLSAAGVVSLAGLLLRRNGGEDNSVGRLSILMFLCVLAGFVSYNMNYFQAQARYLYPASFAISFAVGFGLWRLTGARRFWIAAGAWLAALLALNVYIAFVLLPEAFAKMLSPS